MKRYVRILLEAVVLLLLPSFIQAAGRVSGKVTTGKDEPLPFVNVVVIGTADGTTSNSEGVYSLELPSGEYTLGFSMIGFHQVRKSISVADEDVRLDVALEPESYRLREVEIRAGEEDPAYEVIRNAQRRRRFHLEQVRSFSCDAYVKSTQRLLSYPKKFMGQKIEIDNEMDTVTGIFYLSESVSRIAFLYPGKVRETMISSKVSGNPKAYSFNRGADLLRFSLYEQHLPMAELVPRGIVSPIAENAMFYYDYRLKGAFMEDGALVNRIAVIPRRKNDPVFEGELFIIDETWRIHSADLFITRNHQLQFLDTFRIRTTTLRASDTCRVPFSEHFSFSFDFLGFKGTGDVLGVFSGYDLRPGWTASDFTGEILKVEKSSNEKDSVYWETSRPVPLTLAESRDYVRSDSVRELKESKPYLDSIDLDHNRWNAGTFLSGYSHRNSFRNRQWEIRSPLSGVQFNTVQGWNLTLSGEYLQRKSKDSRDFWKTEARFMYGFSDRLFHPWVSYSRRNPGLRSGRWSVAAGSEVLQFNQRAPITPLINSGYSLLEAKNFMKVFSQRSINYQYRSEIINGLSLRAGLTWAERIPCSNTTEETFSRSDRDYTVNDPVLMNGDTVRLFRHTAALVDVKLRFTPGQEFVTYPDAKYAMGSKWPEFEFTYRKGVRVQQDSPDFDHVEVHVEDRMDLRLLGSFSYRLGAGAFLNTREVPFTDWRHFNGNRTLFSGFALDDFMGLDYYSYSTTDPFFEVHAEQHFNGFLFNKLPLLRSLKLDEVVSAHYVSVRGKAAVVELGAGIEKLNIFRVQVYSSYSEGSLGAPGVVLGVRKMF